MMLVSAMKERMKEADSMIGEVSDKEIKEAMFEIDTNKASSVEKTDSWGWKSMLLIRDVIRNHVWYDIGNGMKASLWYEKWSRDGPLSTIISRKDIYNARLDDNARVAHMIKENHWDWPDGWKEKIEILRKCDISNNLWSKMNNLSFKMDMNFKLHGVVDSLAGRKGKNNIGESRSEEVLFKIICKSVKSKLMAVKVKKSFRTIFVAKEWNLQWRNHYLIAA
uniref:RNA-directed DNA polymerase, eukaryota, reverse transcriptase zinc-binding domain protein n=1 Tax=Tanacetum cinerariifolium TaxID=118510 RepID=A0A699I1H5_TANCI|nr:RNA-directed DNA polymerase, eukaryota, reverse transcriptase zinc-binding domain protein [Tanacetum cinerariifolium]